jgi:hypothetical protein
MIVTPIEKKIPALFRSQMGVAILEYFTSEGHLKMFITFLMLMDYRLDKTIVCKPVVV